MKVADISGPQLDLLVAVAEGGILEGRRILWPDSLGAFSDADEYCPTEVDAEGGPIILRERIAVIPLPSHWEAQWYGPTGTKPSVTAQGPTPLIAAMRAYVSAKLGPEITSN